MNKQFDEKRQSVQLNSMDQIELALELAKLPRSSRNVDIFLPCRWSIPAISTDAMAVRDILPEGVSVCRSAKTWQKLSAYHLCHRDRRRHKSVGEIPVRQGDVLYLALEDGRATASMAIETLLRDILSKTSAPGDGLAGPGCGRSG